MRQAAAEDLEWCARLMAESDPWRTLGRGLEACREAMARPGYEVFVAWEGDARAGFLLLHARGVAGSPYIASIAVAEAFRGRGLGARMVRFTEDHYRPLARHLFLCVSSFNQDAQRLYARLGFRQVGLFENYVIAGADELLMHKRLEQA